MISGLLIQMSTLTFLLLQSIVLPLMIGLHNYGEAIYAISVVLLIGALFEPVAQHGVTSLSAQHNIKSTTKAIMLIMIIAVTIIQLGLYMGSKISFHLFVGSCLAGVMFLSAIYVQAVAYAYGLTQSVARATMLAAVLYAAYLIIVYIFNFRSSLIYIYGFVLAQSSICIAVHFAINSFSITQQPAVKMKYKEHVWYTVAIESLAWRLFFILFTILYVWCVGEFQSLEDAGKLKLGLSLILGLRYLWPVNTPMFHKKAMEDRKSAISSLLHMLLFYLCVSLLFYACGKWLTVRVEFLKPLSLVFEFIELFLAAPVLLSGMAIGSIYLCFRACAWAICASIISFIMAVASLSVFGPAQALANGLIVFGFTFIAFFLWKKHVYSW